MKNDRDRMKCIISETIVALCNSGLDFSSELCVEGLLGITLDGRDILLVNINEVIKLGVSGTKMSGAKTLPSRNIDNDIGNEPISSEDASSSDLTTKLEERHTSTNNRFSTKLEQNSRSDLSHEVISRNQTDHTVSETTQMQVKTDPDEVAVININDEEEVNDSLCDNSKFECYPHVGFWMENCKNTNTDSAQQIVSEVAVSHSCIAQGSLSNIHMSDQHCEKVLKVESTTTDTPGSLTRGYQQNYLGTVAIPESHCANASTQQVPTSAVNVHHHSQTFNTTYQMRQYRRYTQTALADAVTAVQNHSMTVNCASRVFNVPRSTIQIRLLKLSGKKTWGNRSEKQPCSGGSLQDVGNETMCRTLTEDQQQNNASLLTDSDAG